MQPFKLTYLGHAGWLIEHENFRCLCDPWFSDTGAFFSQWLPFPDNTDLPIDEYLHNLDFIYISHAHEDHLDRAFLEKVKKETLILIPKFRDPVLRATLKKMGFSSVREMNRDDECIVKKVTVKIIEDEGYLDQDSCLLLDDGTHKILNLNDCHLDFATLEKRIGSVDLLLLQATSAIWWPCAYDYSAEVLKKKCKQKRINAVRRAVNYAKTLNARLTLPNAGPPIFRDRALHYWNETRRATTNPFILADDAVRMMADQQVPALALTPGDVVMVEEDIQIEADKDKFAAIYDNLAEYIHSYEQRIQDVYGVSKKDTAAYIEMLDKFKEGVRDICSHSQIYAGLLPFWVLFDFDGIEKIAVNFSEAPDKCLQPYDDSLFPEIRYQFVLCPDTMCELFNSRYIDFERYFLGTNFKCRRDPDVYNEILFTLLKNFDIGRLLISEKIYAERKDLLNETYAIEYNGKKYEVQRYCPHMLADLQRSGYINEAGNLVCSLHGWEFQLGSGKCLTNRKCSLGVTELKS